MEGLGDVQRPKRRIDIELAYDSNPHEVPTGLKLLGELQASVHRACFEMQRGGVGEANSIRPLELDPPSLKPIAADGTYVKLESFSR